MRKLQVRTAAVRALIVATALLACAAAASANFEITVTPNPLQVQAGKSADVMISTQNLGLPPEAATIEYSIMGIHPMAGGPDVPVRTKAMPAMGPAFPPVPLSIPVPMGTAPGEYVGSIVGVVKDAKGGVIGPKEFSDVLHVEVSPGEATGPCVVTAEPASIELTRDSKAKEVTAHVSANCPGPQVIAAFAMMGHGINADLCNVKLTKQADGSYPDAKFTVRAAPTADAPPEGIDWQIGLLQGTKRIGEPGIVNIKLAGEAAPATPPAPTQTAARVEVTPDTIEIEPGQTATVQVKVSVTTPGLIQNGLFVNTTYQNSPAQVEGEQFQLPVNSVHQVHVTANASVPPNAQGDIVFTVMSPQVTGVASGTLHVKMRAPAAPAKLPRSFPAASGMLKNAEYNQCLTLENGQHGDGTRLVLAECGSKPDAQTFHFGANGEIASNQQCVVLAGNMRTDDTAIILWTCSQAGAGNNEWTFDSQSRLIGREFQKCLEPNGSDPSHAAILRPCWDGANQKWNVEQPPAPAPARLPRSFPAASGMLKNADLGTCLTIENNQHNDGARLVMTQCGSQTEAQTFKFGPNGEIQNGNKCAVLSANSTSDDTPIVLWTCNNGGQSNEMWTFDSSSRLIGREFQKCMEPNGSDPTSHGAILRPCWDGANQKWSVEQPPQRLAVNFPMQGGWIKNPETGLCLSANGDNNEQPFVLAKCSAGAKFNVFSVGPNGELKVFGNKCAVLKNNSTDDNTPVIVYQCSNKGQTNELWTMDASNRLVTRDSQKCLEAGADAQRSAILRPCWDGGNQKWSFEAPQSVAEFTIRLTTPQLSVPVGTSYKELRWAVEPKNLMDMPNERLPFTVDYDRSYLATMYGDDNAGSVRPNDVIATAFRGLKQGQTTVKLTVTSPSSGVTHTVEVPVRVTRGGGDETGGFMGGIFEGGGDGGRTPRAGGGANRDNPDAPGSQPEPAAPPVPVNISSFNQAVDQIRGENADIEGLADALDSGEHVFDGDHEAQQAAFERVYEAAIQAATSLPPEVAQGDPAIRDIDAAVIARMIEQAESIRQAPQYQTAGIGNMRILMEDVAGLYRAGQRNDWRQYNTVERVIQQLKVGRAANNAAKVTDLANKVCDIIEAGLNTLPPGVDLEPHVKAFEASAAAISVADAAAKAVKWMMPNKIVALYTVIKNQRREKGSAPVDLRTDEQADVKFYMITQTPSEQVMSPYGLGKMIASRVLKMQRFQKWLSKIPLKRQETFADVQWHLTGIDKRLGQVWAPLYGLHLDQYAEVWQLPSRKSKEILIDTASVLDMRAICHDPSGAVTDQCPDHRIDIGQTPTGPKTSQFWVKGVNPGLAGYFFALKPALVAQIMPEEQGTRFNRRAEVNVTGDPKDGGPAKPGTPCAWNPSTKMYDGLIGSDGKCYGNH